MIDNSYFSSCFCILKCRGAHFCTGLALRNNIAQADPHPPTEILTVRLCLTQSWRTYCFTSNMKTEPVVVALHTATDFVKRQGAGAGIIQRAMCAATGRTRHDLIPTMTRKKGLNRGRLEDEKVKSEQGARLFALIHAIGLAHWTIKRIRRRLGFSDTEQTRSNITTVQSVVAYTDSHALVDDINHHIRHAPDSLLEIACPKECRLMKYLVAGVKRVSKYGPDVSIAVSSGSDEDEIKVRRIAKAKGRKACASRRSTKKRVAQLRASQVTCDLPIRTKDRTTSAQVFDYDTCTLHKSVIDPRLLV